MELGRVVMLWGNGVRWGCHVVCVVVMKWSNDDSCGCHGVEQ